MTDEFPQPPAAVEATHACRASQNHATLD